MRSAGPLLRRVPWLDLVLLATLGALVYVYTLGPTQGWFEKDDFRNTRWVLEYWSTPWRGLLERHALHGHVRPLVHLALWAVTPSYGDPYLPQLALLHSLRALALLGVGALTMRLGGSRTAALLAMLFGATLHGFELLGTWVAWVCSAGQIALGLWALVAWDRALARGQTPWLALVCTVAAGLFKEPAWIVIPLGALAITLGRGRVSRWWFAFVVVGAAGMAYAWHPDNAIRYLSAGGGLAARVWEGLLTLPANAISGWPAWSQAVDGALPGIPLLVVTGVLATELAPGRLGYALWALTAAVGLFGPPVGGSVVTALALAVVLRRPTRPPIGLVLFLVETGLSIPLDIRNDVQALGGSLGLAIHTALGTARLLNAAAPPVVRGVTALGLVAWAAGSAVALTHMQPPDAALRAERDRVLGIAALVSVMGPAEVVVADPRALSDELLPLTGLFERTRLARPAAIALGDHLLLNPPPGIFEQNIVTRSRVSPSSVAWLGESAREAGDLKRDGTLRVLEPGWYAIGIAPLRLGGRTFQSALHARDGCGTTWTATSPAEDVPVALQVLHLKEGCTGVRLGWTGSRSLEALFVLAPLAPNPRLDAYGRVPVAPHLEVEVHADPTLAGP